VRLVCLEVVNYAVHTQGLDAPSLTFLKETLLRYVQETYGRNQEDQIDPAHLQNKLCQTLTYLFVFLYKEGWESFIDDFLSLTSLPNSSQRDNVAGVLLYLRILGSVHDEIADLLLTRQTSDAKRNTELKDMLRARDMEKIAQSWRELLAVYGTRNDTIVEMILRVIGKWVSWMDISLVITQEMLNLLLPVVGRGNPTGVDKVRDAAIDTLTEIVGKGMKPPEKMELISFLNLREIISQLVASPPLSEWRGTSRYDTDLAEGVGKLVNAVMSDIVDALSICPPGDNARALADQHLRDFLPFLLRFISDDYDEICSIVIPSITDLLTALRKVPTPLPPAYSEMLPPMLNAIILKMRYDETSNWGDEDEQTDEAEFQELRKRLQNLQKTVAAVDQNLYVEVLSNLVANTFQRLDQQGSQMDWRDLDLALHEMYLFGELALPNQGLGPKNQPSAAASERLVVMVQKMVESGWSFLRLHASTPPNRYFRDRQLSSPRNPSPVHGDLCAILCCLRHAPAVYRSGFGELRPAGTLRPFANQDSVVVSLPQIHQAAAGPGGQCCGDRHPVDR
jgi:exportin-T